MDAPFTSDPLFPLLEEARRGSAEAVQKLFDLCRKALQRHARRRLRQPLRTLFDSEDFLQDVALKLSGRELPTDVFDSLAAFMGYLKRILANELTDAERRYLRSAKRNLRRDVHLDCTPLDLITFEDSIKEGTGAGIEDLLNRLRDLPPVYKAILTLRSQGFTQVQIAEKLSIGERTVRRILKKVAQNGYIA